MGPGELGEPVQKKEDCWISGAPDVEGDDSSERPVKYLCSSTSSCCSSAQGPARGRRVCSFLGVGYLGLFGLQLMGGSWPVQGCLLQCVGEEEAAGQKRMLA